MTSKEKYRESNCKECKQYGFCYLEETDGDIENCKSFEWW